MKYSTRNLADAPTPLPFPIKITVEFCPRGERVDFAPIFYSATPEADTDKIVVARGWDSHPDYKPEYVWVDGGL
jgi:hypothetical protein